MAYVAAAELISGVPLFDAPDRQTFYRRVNEIVVPALGTPGELQRVIRAPSHCGFYAETRQRAFDDLVAWIERGVHPEGEDVLAPDLSRIGLEWTPVLHPDDPLAPRR